MDLTTHGAALASLVLAPCLLVATGERGTTAQFRSEIQLVPLTVTVTNAAGGYVSGLTAPDFTVLDEGRPQKVSYFAASDSPVDVTLLLDVSGSMAGNLALAQEAASGLAARLRAGDRIAVAGVSSNMVGFMPLTTDKTQIGESIRSLRAGGSTALYDGMYVLLRELERHRQSGPGIRRQAMIALSDGVDTASRVDFDFVREYLVRGDVVLYVVLLQSGEMLPAHLLTRSETEAPARMMELVQATGGRLFKPKTPADLPAIYAAVADEFSDQYLLAYTPPPDTRDGEFRRVSVRVRHPDVIQARTRAGYFALGSRRAPADGR
ncbi:MAG TPA: VWA domain-containing protein [Vicinamibacterales bacterium]|nr:VWA domain-containing protein [Vicinamibacterales bacterium]